MTMKSYFQVRYRWTDARGTHHGRTVVSATSQAEADAILQRANPHITVIQA